MVYSYANLIAQNDSVGIWNLFVFVLIDVILNSDYRSFTTAREVKT